MYDVHLKGGHKMTGFHTPADAKAAVGRFFDHYASELMFEERAPEWLIYCRIGGILVAQIVGNLSEHQIADAFATEEFRAELIPVVSEIDPRAQ